MRRCAALFLLWLVFAGSATASDEADVRAAMMGLTGALNALDLDALSKYFADDITAFVPAAQPDRVQGRDAVVRIFRTFIDRVRPTTPRLDIVPEDMEVRVSGGLALVSFNVREKTVTRRRTFVFEKRDGRWLVRHFHASDFVIPPAIADIEAVNRAIAGATRRMDNEASVALWEDDGVSLLPGQQPIAGKAAIAAFINGVTKQFPGAHMESFTLDCHDISVAGDLASEWCEEHQIVRFSDHRAPFDGRGKILYVFHRGADGRWRIKTEMWNQGVRAP